MAGASQKPVRVTIRLIPEKAQVYHEFKTTVTEKLHSDVCYVTTMLMESFNNAVNETPNAEPIVMRFLKQSIQINMGCSFNYFTKKARRTPQDLSEITTDPHNVIPDVVDQYPNLSFQSRAFWFREFQEQGIIPKDTVDPYAPKKEEKPKKQKRNFRKKLWSIVRHLSSGLSFRLRKKRRK